MVQQQRIQAVQSCRDQPHINLVFAAELSYVQLLDSGCCTRVHCTVYQSSLLSLKNVWTSECAAVLQSSDRCAAAMQ